MATIAVAHNNNPRVSAYPWTPGAGFGIKYANPLTLPASNGYGVAFCGSTDIAVSHDLDPYVSAYPWTPGVGFGVKYANPATKPTGLGYGVAFCGSTDIAVAHATAPFVTAYPWTPGVGFGVKYADPGAGLTLSGRSVAFCGNTDIAVGGASGAPLWLRVVAYPWTPGVGFGVKYADPGIIPTGPGYGVAFCGNTDIAVAHFTAPFVTAYPWTPGVGFGVKYANPGTKPADIGFGVAFCGSTDIAVSHNGAPNVSAYPWTPGAGFGIKYANPLTLPASTGYGVAFYGSTDIAVSHDLDPYVTAYPWTPGVGFGIKYANPATKPTGLGYGVAFETGPDLITAYKDVGTLFKLGLHTFKDVATLFKIRGSNDCETLTPWSDGDLSQLTITPAAPATHFDKVQAMGDARLVSNGTAFIREDLWHFTTLTRNDVGPRKIIIAQYCFGNNFTVRYWETIKIGGVDYVVAGPILFPYYTGPTYMYTILYNSPASGLSWTLPELATFQAGVRIEDTGIPSGGYVDHYFIRVTWVDAAVQTMAVTGYTGVAADLNGLVLYDECWICQVRFEWGLNIAYGNVTAWQPATKGTAFTAHIAGLNPALIYHYRAVITTPAGETFYGLDETTPITSMGGNMANEMVRRIFI